MSKSVILYSTSGCPLCERYRTFLAERMREDPGATRAPGPSVR